MLAVTPRSSGAGLYPTSSLSSLASPWHCTSATHLVLLMFLAFASHIMHFLHLFHLHLLLLSSQRRLHFRRILDSIPHRPGHFHVVCYSRVAASSAVSPGSLDMTPWALCLGHERDTPDTSQTGDRIQLFRRELELISREAVFVLLVSLLFPRACTLAGRKHRKRKVTHNVEPPDPA